VTAQEETALLAVALPVPADRAKSPITLTRPSERTTTLLLHVAVLVALPLLLLLLNDSWNSGWVTTPNGAEWVEVGNNRQAPPPGLLVNHTQDYLDTPISWVDPFVYQSFFLDLKGTLNLHQEEYGWRLYYHSRLPWLLLGNAAYSVAPPATANLLLHLVLFYVATFALYATVRMATKNDLAALVAAALLGVNTYFLASIGWNYLDGFGATLILLTLALLTKAAVSDAWRLPMLLAGAAIMTAVSVNIFLVIVMPGAAAWYLLLNTRRHSHGLIAGGALVLAGGALGVAFYSLINLYLTGDPLYFMPQIWWATVDAEPARRDLYPEAGWIVIPGAALVLSIALAVLAAARRIQRRAVSEGEALGLAGAVAFLLVGGVYAYLNFLTKSNVLEHSIYVTYLIPFAFLAIGTAAHHVSSTWSVSPKQQAWFVAGLVLCLFAPFALAQLRFMPGCPEGCLSSGSLQFLLAATVALIAVAVVTRSARVGLALLVVYSLINVGVADQRALTFSISERQAMHRQSAMVFDTQALVDKHNVDHDLLYWLDLSDAHGWVHAAVAGQNLWDNRLVSLEFPKIRNAVELKDGDRVMLASSTRDDDTVRRADEALAPQGMHLDVFDTSRVQRDGDGFDVIIATVKPVARP
jgi:hypothetical protein